MGVNSGGAKRDVNMAVGGMGGGVRAEGGNSRRRGQGAGEPAGRAGCSTGRGPGSGVFSLLSLVIRLQSSVGFCFSSSVFVFCLFFFFFVFLVCSTSLPGGNQVDGLPPA